MNDAEFSNLARDCIVNFNFYRVHDAMTALNWTWGGASKPPPITEMVVTARDLLQRSYQSALTDPGRVGIWSTGGFQATVDFNQNLVSLAFIVEESDAEG